MNIFEQVNVMIRFFIQNKDRSMRNKFGRRRASMLEVLMTAALNTPEFRKMQIIGLHVTPTNDHF